MLGNDLAAMKKKGEGKLVPPCKFYRTWWNIIRNVQTQKSVSCRSLFPEFHFWQSGNG